MPKVKFNEATHRIRGYIGSLMCPEADGQALQQTVSEITAVGAVGAGFGGGQR
jgi:hypothetical protein